MNEPKMCSTTEWELAQAQKALHAMPGPKRVYVEIGSHQGGSLINIAGACVEPGGVIVGIDKTDSPECRMSLYEAVAALRSRGFRSSLLFGRSEDRKTQKELRRILVGHPIDILFIDGGHSRQAARSDAEMYAPMVRKGGVVMFHDIGPRLTTDLKPKVAKIIEGVRDVWAEWSAKYPVTAFQEWAGFGLVWV